MIALTNQYGQIEISTDVIAKIVGAVAASCDGIVGMASTNQLKDGFDEWLKKETASRGVVVHFDQQERLLIDMYILVSYGTQISNVAIQLQHRVKSALIEMIGLQAAEINIYVQGVCLVSVEDGQKA
ncbi:MAG: Asp23/Gls24 family envelope stress response protein [Sporolactobacillus sp.]